MTLPTFMSLATLAKELDVGESTIEAWVRKGTFPPPVKMGGLNRWRWKEVEKHIAGGKALSATSDEAQRVREATREAVREKAH